MTPSPADLSKIALCCHAGARSLETGFEDCLTDEERAVRREHNRQLAVNLREASLLAAAMAHEVARQSKELAA